MKALTGRQKEIVGESIKLVSENGIQELTIKNISKRIGVSEPAVYRHFENKLDILMAILGFFEDNSKEFFSNIDRKTGFINCVEKIFIGRCAEFSQNRSLASVIFSEDIFRNEKTLSSKIMQIMRMNHTVMLEFIKQGQIDNEIRADIDADHICHIVLGSLRLLVTKWRLSDYGFDLNAESAKIWESLKKLIINC